MDHNAGHDFRTGEDRDAAQTAQGAAAVRAVLEAIQAPSALLNEVARIVAVNAAWLTQLTEPGLSPLDLDIGRVYLHEALRTPDGEHDCARRQREGIDQVLRGERDGFVLDATETPWGGGLTVTPWGTSLTRGALLIRHQDTADDGDPAAPPSSMRAAYAVAERRLRRSEASLTASQRIAHLGSWELDLVDVGDLAEGALRWSDEVFRIWGYEPGGLDVTYENFLQAVHPDDRALISEAVAAALRENRSYDITHRIVRPDGSVRVVREQAEFEFDPIAGHPTRMIGTVLDVTDQQRATEVVAHTLERLHSAQEIAQIGDWEWEVATDEITWSPQMFAIVGRDPELGPPRDYAIMEQLFDRPSQLRQRECVSQVLKSGDSADYELLVVRPDGVQVPVYARAVAVTDRAGRVVGLRGTLQDMSARKAAEAAMDRAVQRLTEAQRIGRIGDWEWDQRTGEITWSPAVYEIFGRSPDQGPPRGFEEQLELYDGPSQEIVREKVALALSTGQPQEYELVAVRNDGESLHMLARAVPRLGASGELIALSGTVQDITERKRAEMHSMQLASIVESSDHAILSITLDGIVTSWNRGAETVYGYTAAEMIGTPVARLIPARRLKEEAEIISKVRRGESVSHFETFRVRSDDRMIEVSVTVSPMRDLSGAVIGASQLARDISDQKKLERQFLRAQRMESIGTLAGGIAHDLNNVLTPIMLSLEMLRMVVPDDASREMLDTIQLSAQHGADLVRQVLTFARGIEGERLEVRVDHLVRDVERTARDTFLKYIDVRSSVATDLWRVIGDPTQLQQVLVNLCVNARDAMPDGGTLTITAANVTLDASDARLNIEATAGPYVLVCVEDSGTGISPGDIERIFEPFFTTKDVGRGTGLGLSTSLAIVKSHGGFLRVYSESGQGSTFTVYLPAHTTVDTGEHATAVSPPRGHGELVLVVDDEPSVRHVTQKTLESFGYRVMLASDGAEAVATYARHSDEIAVVLTDMMMPVMDGSEAIHRLRALNPAVRIVAASGLVNSGRATAEGLGLRQFLTKPYTASTLLSVIHECLHGTA